MASTGKRKASPKKAAAKKAPAKKKAPKKRALARPKLKEPITVPVPGSARNARLVPAGEPVPKELS